MLRLELDDPFDYTGYYPISWKASLDPAAPMLPPIR